jgi:hypothetical protein
MKRRATLLSLFAIASLMAAAPARENAVIVNSGSTNAMGYKISVWSDGTATLTMQHRDGSAVSAPKAFDVRAATATRFFSDLAAARSARIATVPCMKSVSFGTTTRVTWQGWVSPDLDCPPKDSLGDALVKDLGEIIKAAGVGPQPLP